MSIHCREQRYDKVEYTVWRPKICVNCRNQYQQRAVAYLAEEGRYLLPRYVMVRNEMEYDGGNEMWCNDCITKHQTAANAELISRAEHRLFQEIDEYDRQAAIARDRKKFEADELQRNIDFVERLARTGISTANWAARHGRACPCQQCQNDRQIEFDSREQLYQAAADVTRFEVNRRHGGIFGPLKE